MYPEISQSLQQQDVRIDRKVREQSYGNCSFTMWLTGLSGAGKSTLAAELENRLFGKQKKIYVLDGDILRSGINNDLSFSDQDRMEQIRRTAQLAKLFNDAGIIIIAALISPFIAGREMARKIIGADSFIEIYVDAQIETCKKRDSKGLYQLAAEGKISNFTGLSSNYESPVNPELHIRTDDLPVDVCASIIEEYLITKGFVTTVTTPIM